MRVFHCVCLCIRPNRLQVGRRSAGSELSWRARRWVVWSLLLHTMVLKPVPSIYRCTLGDRRGVPVRPLNSGACGGSAGFELFGRAFTVLMSIARAPLLSFSDLGRSDTLSGYFIKSMDRIEQMWYPTNIQGMKRRRKIAL